MKKIWMLVPVMAFCLFALSAHAQDGDAGSGCDTSPENPTLILALVGSAGAAGAVVRGKLAARRIKKQ